MLAQIEMLLGSIGVTLSLFFGVLLLNKKPSTRRNLFLAIYFFAFGLRVGKSLFHNFFDISPLLRTYFLSLLFCIGPSLWLFTKYLVNPNKGNLGSDVAHYGVFILLLPFCWLIPNNGSFAFYIFYQATIIHMAVYVMYTLFWFNQSKSGFKVQNKNTYTFWVSFLWTNLAIVLLYFLISQDIIPYYIGLSFIYSAVIVIFTGWGLKFPQLISPLTEKYQSSKLSHEEIQIIHQRLIVLMEQEKPYLDPALNLAELSRQVGASPKELSQTINQMSKLNYAQFISKLRVEEAKLLLISPAHADFKIATIAFECGFDSISSFNSHFKNHTSLTAQAYRNRKK